MSETSQMSSLAFKESANPYAAGSFDELCSLAAQLFAVDAAAVVLNQNGISRLVSSHGLKIAMKVLHWDFNTAPYAQNEIYILPDALKSAYCQRLAHEIGISPVGAFIRLPLTNNNLYSLSLLLFNSKPIKHPTAAKIKLLNEIGKLVKEERNSTVEMLIDLENDVTVAKTLDEVKISIVKMQQAVFLLDASLEVIAANGQASEITNLAICELIGLTHNDISPRSAGAVQFLYLNALKTLVSPPDFEVILNSASPRIFRINVTPFSPIDTRDYFLLVTVEETTDFAARTTVLSNTIDKSQPFKTSKDPSQIFLIDTLVRRRSIRQRKQTNFVVLRAWRQSIKPYQITALKALKQNIPPNFSQEIAKEIASEVESLFGLSGFKAIVPMPCGHSQEPMCLSLEIARALSLHTGIPVIQAFVSEPVKGVSHPKENVKRPPMKMIRIITEPVLLVDDVATSGSHLEEAVSLLKPICGAVLPVAWLGGDVSEVTDD